jgi:ABC-2 type transport system permease protein
MIATLRYELRMQVHRRALWTVYGLMLVLLLLVIRSGLPAILSQPSRTAMVRVTIFCNLLLPLGYAFLLSDRLVRDHRLGVASVLDATPAGRWRRLLGKYLGAVAGGAIPVAVISFGFAAAYAVRNDDASALLWASAVFSAVSLPALLFAGALALAGPLLMPASVSRILFFAYWIWSSYLVPPRQIPTFAQTIVSPMGGYPIQVFFGYHGLHAASSDWAGPVPGALFNSLRPPPTTAAAWLSIAILLGLTALVLLAAHLVTRSRTR